MTVTVPKGLATWAGIIAALGQYALAIALFLDTFDETNPTAGVAALVTATATLWKTIDGRMKQAQTLVRAEAAKQVASSRAAGNAAAPLLEAHRAGADNQREEPGDPDWLPDYETTEHPPPDEGDVHARPEGSA